MTKQFMSYSRASGGAIERNHKRITPKNTEDYSQKESLLGWPEKVVFWQVLADGSAQGIAPMQPEN